MHLACVDQDDTLSGFACAYDGQEASRAGLWSVELVALYVLPEAWGRGIGRALHEWFTGVRRRSHTADVGTLYVWSNNERAVRSYTANGWKRSGPTRPGPLDIPFISMQLLQAGPKANVPRRTRPPSQAT